MRRNGLYEELVNEFNFYDYSVGINPINYNDEEMIIDVLEMFNLIPIGYYETRNSEGYKFSDGKTTYSLKYENGKFNICELIEL